MHWHILVLQCGMHAYSYSYIYIYIYTYIHTYIYIYVCLLFSFSCYHRFHSLKLNLFCRCISDVECCTNAASSLFYLSQACGAAVIFGRAIIKISSTLHCSDQQLQHTGQVSKKMQNDLIVVLQINSRFIIVKN